MNTQHSIRNLLIILVLGLSFCGCSSFVGGAAGGVAGAGAGYELSARHQIQVLDKDLAEGRIDKAEYNIRKDQVGRGSLVY